MKIKTNGISMNYEISGKGKCLTLIHGAGDNLESWWNQVPVFSKRYKVLAYDVRGYGQSKAVPESHTVDTLVQDLYELLKALGVKKTHLLGYSMGGRIALGMALDHPDIVLSLIIANSGGAVERSQEEVEARAKLNEQHKKYVQQYGLKAFVDKTAGNAFSLSWPEKNPEIFDQVKKIRVKHDLKGYLIAMNSPIWGMPPSNVGDLKSPTLFIAGKNDTLMGVETARASHKAIPGSQLKIMATGHASMVEKPKEFNSIVLEFLAKADE